MTKMAATKMGTDYILEINQPPFYPSPFLLPFLCAQKGAIMPSGEMVLNPVAMDINKARKRINHDK